MTRRRSSFLAGMGTFEYCGMILTYFGLMQVALFFAKEKPVVQSERGRYDLSAFLLAKFLGELPLTAWCPTVFLATIYWSQKRSKTLGTFLLEVAIVISLNLAVGAARGPDLRRRVSRAQTSRVSLESRAVARRASPGEGPRREIVSRSSSRRGGPP